MTNRSSWHLVLVHRVSGLLPVRPEAVLARLVFATAYDMIDGNNLLRKKV
jgi:hypothetical protein